MFLRDFDSLYGSYVARKHIRFNIKTHKRDYEIKKQIDDAVRKYTQYVFTQISESGGALQLSKVCNFVHVITQNNIEYRGSKIEIFYREKNATHLKIYPNKVLDIFKQNPSCKAVAYSYKVVFERNVLFEKVIPVNNLISYVNNDELELYDYE